MGLPNQERLEAEGGLCILYTHLGSPGFVTQDGAVNSEVRELLVALSKRNGWFKPVSTILDLLRGERVRTLSPLEEVRLRLRSRRWFQ